MYNIAGHCDGPPGSALTTIERSPLKELPGAYFAEVSQTPIAATFNGAPTLLRRRLHQGAKARNVPQEIGRSPPPTARETADRFATPP